MSPGADRPVPDRPSVLLVCSGLDHARRGFESFARECFESLKDEPGLSLELVKGSGRPGALERVAPTLRRDHRVALYLGRALHARPFRIEALAFGLSLQPLILRRPPDLIYLSEWDTARALAAVRNITRQSSRLLLCSGGFASRGFEHLDHVQQLTPAALHYVLANGADPARHSVLPLGFRIPGVFELPTAEERRATRALHGLPIDRMIVITVAAINASHKRVDYLIAEIARLPEPRPFLLIVGETDSETPGIRHLARRRLGPDGHAMMTVAAAEVAHLLRASDAFVLASVVEAQGRALIEAMSQGVLCLAHESPVMRFACGPAGIYADFKRPGSLAALIARHVVAGDELRQAEDAHARHRYVYERFSWDRLRGRYVELFRSVATGEQHGLLFNR